MKNSLLIKAFFSFALLSTFNAQSQPDRFSYAVTDSVRDGVKWNYLRLLDMRTGAYSNTLVRFLNNNELLSSNAANIISCNGIAAIAHDRDNRRLYFTPMLIDRLSYVDLRTMRIQVVSNNFTRLMPKQADQSNIITRMVIADDGKGYALTNDGRNLIRFTTRNNPVITDLGSLVDAPGNNEMSVHNTCSSFGGDLIADDEGNLYLITIKNHVFRIKISTKVARYLGTISGLPASFATSGAAVHQDGKKVVVVSSVDASDVYTVNMRTLAASKLNANNPWLSADLGSSTILQINQHHREYEPAIVNIPSSENDSVLLFPNPVTAGKFTIRFNNGLQGKYAVSVTDANGKMILRNEINVAIKNNLVVVELPAITSKGMFMVRVTDENNKAIFSDKIIVVQ